MTTHALAPIPIENFVSIARGIDRPEDVVVLADGRVFASEHQCAVAQIHPDGTFTRLGPKRGAPNGLNALPDGRLLIANFGIYDGEPGPLEIFDPATGARDILVSEVEGRPLTSSNYPVVDAAGNIWCANSTDAPTWPEALDGRPDGFLYVLPPDGPARIVAEGLRFPNGLALGPDDAQLYCCQTSAADVLVFDIGPGATLGPPRRHGPVLGRLMSGPVDPHDLPPPETLRHLGYTDGCGMDAAGNLWVALPAANKIVAITPSGAVTEIAHDPTGTVMNHPTNIAWGGPDLRDLYVGSIRASHVLKARSPVPGLPMAHQRAER
jgi:gluconolactonase